MDSPVQKIKERLGIEEVASSYLKLERAGANWKAKCPFHNEKTPSFFISPDRGTYYCFGCGASGDIFTFVEEFEGLDFKGALKMLAERAGVELPHYSKETRENKSEKEKLFEAMEEATKYYEENLADNPEGKQASYGAGKEVMEYLKSRGLTEKSIKDFRIGFALADWRTLYHHLQTKRFSDQEIERAGLAKRPDDTTKAMYDRFRSRIMFPIADSSGRIVAFTGRIFPASASGGKYVNSPETPIFHKSSVLYGIDRAKAAIRKNNFSILVEGQMDLILSHQAGYRNTVALSGTALSEQSASKESVVTNIGLVRRLSPNIVLAFDGDAAGFAATIRTGTIALRLGMDVKVVDLPENSDPALLVQNKGPEAWREAIKNSVHIVEFVLRKILHMHRGDARKTRLDSARLAGRDIRERVLPLVGAIESSIEQTHFLKKISELSGIPLHALEDDFKKIDLKEKGETAELRDKEAAKDTLYRRDYIKRKLLGIILWQQSLQKESLNTAEILEELGKLLHTSPAALLDSVKDSTEDLVFEAEIFYTNGADAKNDVQEMLLNLREEILKEELTEKMRELYAAEEAKNAEVSARIFKECQLLNQEIQNIRNNQNGPVK